MLSNGQKGNIIGPSSYALGAGLNSILISYKSEETDPNILNC